MLKITDENIIEIDRNEYKTDEEYLDLVRDILVDPVFLSMEKYIQHGTTTCLEHSIMVSYSSYKICKSWGWDEKSAARAGLLHDLFLYDWHVHAKETGEMFHGFTHPKTALRNAESHFVLSEKEKDIILRHMWPLTPVPPKSLEGLSVIYADKVCSSKETINGIKYKLEPLFRQLVSRESI